MVIVALIFFLHKGLVLLWPNPVFSIAVASLLTAAYIRFVIQVEKKDMLQIPLLGKLVK
jgi:hypothetical protein